jgi:hypothetical protein
MIFAGAARGHRAEALGKRRAIAAVRPSSAIFVERLMKKAADTLSTEELQIIFNPLVDDLEDAVRLLRRAAGSDLPAARLDRDVVLAKHCGSLQ